MLTLAGCATAPATASKATWWKPWTWRADASKPAAALESKRDEIKTERAANSTAILTNAASKVAATGEALALVTNPPPAVSLAKDFNAQAAALLPQPSLAEVKELRALIAGLLSTNATERAAAQSRLDSKDAAIAQLQANAARLQGMFDATTEAAAKEAKRLQDAYAQERAVADQWREHQVKSWAQKLWEIAGTTGLTAAAVGLCGGLPFATRAIAGLSRAFPSLATVSGVAPLASYTQAIAGIESAHDMLKVNSGQLAESMMTRIRIQQNPADSKLIRAAKIMEGLK